ncbi:hypothetical protein FS749_013709 [Ceratobasidium sp. UAMH 11750]|nr:hypothetical protein FS749_013709 [Ceratobasidium sp. UAMH 11750]
MSLRATLSRTATKCPRSHIPLVLHSSSSSPPCPPTGATPKRQLVRPFTSTPSTSRGASRSLIGRFFGARDPPPVHRDPAQVVRDAVETLCVLLQTSPPVRPALLHKPYAELVTAVIAYRASKPKDPLDLTTAVEGQGQTSKADVVELSQLAGDSRHLLIRLDIFLRCSLHSQPLLARRILILRSSS